MSTQNTPTALVVTDPQNDFLSPAGVVWGMVGESVTENGTVENIESPTSASGQRGAHHRGGGRGAQQQGAHRGCLRAAAGIQLKLSCWVTAFGVGRSPPTGVFADTNDAATVKLYF